VSQALVFAASPEDLGLTENNGFLYAKPYIPVRTSSIRNFQTNADAKKFFLDNYKNSQVRFDEAAAIAATINPAAEKPYKRCGFPDAICEPVRPQLICQMHGEVEVIPRHPAPAPAPAATAASSSPEAHGQLRASSSSPSAFLQGGEGVPPSASEGSGPLHAWHSDEAYDRRQPTCCVPWSWESGQVPLAYTSRCPVYRPHSYFPLFYCGFECMFIVSLLLINVAFRYFGNRHLR
jgi:hypothetical protein